jgi:hypothetical protein
VVLVGQRAQALDQRPERLHLDRQLAGPGHEQRAAHLEPVAQVDLLDSVVGLQRVALEVGLQRAAGILQRHEGDLAHVAHRHGAPGQRHDLVGEGRAGLGAFVRGVQRRGVVAGAVAVRVRFEAPLFEALQVPETLLALLLERLLRHDP